MCNVFLVSYGVKKELVMAILIVEYTRILEFAYLSASLPTQMHHITDES
jgi:hypothetical protein